MITETIALFFIGLLAGAINTLAGGGSLLTLPALIFMGLPPVMANATNRIGVFFSAFFAWRGYQSKGYKVDKYSLVLGIIALVGAYFGSLIAVNISGALFNKILAAVILLIVAYMLFGKSIKTGDEVHGKKSQVLGYFSFLIIGVYGGFIQAGVGYLIMASLSIIHNIAIVKVNLIKAFVVVIYTLASLFVFIEQGLINWELGIALALGMSLGGWLTSRWSTKVNEKYIRYFVMATAIFFAVKLFFF